MTLPEDTEMAMFVDRLRAKRIGSSLDFDRDCIKAAAAISAQAARIAELEAAASHLLHDIDDLIANSEGVAGLHMNGDIAEWESLLDGGSFGSWLSSAEQLRAVLTSAALTKEPS